MARQKSQPAAPAEVPTVPLSEARPPKYGWGSEDVVEPEPDQHPIQASPAGEPVEEDDEA